MGTSIPEEIRREAIRRVEAGEPRARVARELGVAETTIRRWVDPEYAAVAARKAAQWRARHPEYKPERDPAKVRESSRRFRERNPYYERERRRKVAKLTKRAQREVKAEATLGGSTHEAFTFVRGADAALRGVSEGMHPGQAQRVEAALDALAEAERLIIAIGPVGKRKS